MTTLSPEDAQLALDGAKAFIEKYTGMTLDVTDFDEVYKGNGQLSLVLDHFPVNEVTSIAQNTGTIANPVWTTLSNNTYVADTATGVVDFVGHMGRGLYEYRIIYKAGFDTIPADLQLAIKKLASYYTTTRETNGISSESVAGDSISYDKGSEGIPYDILAILNHY